jgi:rfaE bifunctional protein kinase chain/domain
MQVASLSAARLLIVGDVMLDRYWFGDVSRISPEAPVPVVKVARSEERPGGAANVARNVAALGARVSLLSVVGDDEAGRNLQALLAASGIDVSLHIDAAISTTVKLRVIGRQQQLLRIDFETTPSHEVLRTKLVEFEARLGECDAVILSDYGKGGLAHISEMIRMARAAGKKVLVDPKGDDFSKYAGATIVTPNRAELREVVGRWQDDDGTCPQGRSPAPRARTGGLAGDPQRGGDVALPCRRSSARAGGGERSLRCFRGWRYGHRDARRDARGRGRLGGRRACGERRRRPGGWQTRDGGGQP